jgi:hypothetical protein
VIDRHALAVGELTIRGSSDGARGQQEADQRHGDEPWTATAHAVF